MRSRGGLAEAVADYPVMRYVLAAADVEYRTGLELLVGLFVCLRMDRGSPVLGVRLDESLSAHFYQRPGYRVTGQAQVEELDTWNLILVTG